MNFVSYLQFYADIAAWERQLPEFDAVCGVPRSGLIPAAHIALRRNLRLVDFSELMSNPNESIKNAYIRDNNFLKKYNIPFTNRLLVVDDSSSSDSVTFTELRQKLQNTELQISYGAVYRASALSKVDYYFREIPQPRLFEWNMWRNRKIEQVYCDMDGVLCEDWKGPPETTDDTAFTEHVINAKPLYVPCWPVKAIVTSRIEKYRKMTESWLAINKINYERLIMHPATTPELRRIANDHAERKALAYQKDEKALLFIESDKKQAVKIFSLTRRPVLCTDTMTLISKD